MNRRQANRLVLLVEIVLTLFIVSILLNNSFDNVEQEVKQYESGLASDYERLLSAYKTDFKMMINEITPEIRKDISFDEMQSFVADKEKLFEDAIGKKLYDGISFTYKGGYVHSWNYGDYSHYDPQTRPWYKTAKEANGKIAITAPYLTYLDDAELTNGNESIVLTLTQKYTDDIYFCYDIKTFAINELLSNRYTRYPGTIAMMYDKSGYVLSSSESEYYCHNVYKKDAVINEGFMTATKNNEKKKNAVHLTWIQDSLQFVYYTTDTLGNNYSVIIPFMSVMQHAFLGSFIIAILLLVVEVWIYLRSIKHLKMEMELVKVKNTSQMKQDFLARMSHDMRTPMNGILGLSQLSIQENDVMVLKDNMEKIHASGEYLLGLINDSLDLQKIESGKFVLNPAVVSTSQLIGTSADMIKLSAQQKNIQFLITNKNANIEGYIRVDPMRIRQIFVNLLSNAIKFTPVGGKVELTIEVLGREGNKVHDRITVSDTGIGMSEDFMQNKLFQPFSQEHNELTDNQAGSGLGLSIVKRIVDEMGGTISVKSELGKGTTFIIDINFEIVDDGENKNVDYQNITQESFDITQLKGIRILLAEDHPLNKEIAIKILEKAGCIVTWAKDGQECVEIFEKSSPDTFDLILMDIRMPRLDGLQATKQIRLLNRDDARNVPILAMSANAYSEDVEKSITSGMNGHLSKPIQMDELYRTIFQYTHHS